jgi:hypothetical protein
VHNHNSTCSSRGRKRSATLPHPSTLTGQCGLQFSRRCSKGCKRLGLGSQVAGEAAPLKYNNRHYKAGRGGLYCRYSSTWGPEVLLLVLLVLQVQPHQVPPLPEQKHYRRCSSYKGQGLWARGWRTAVLLAVPTTPLAVQFSTQVVSATPAAILQVAVVMRELPAGYS